MNRRTRETEIEDMKPVAWKADGTPTRFEIVQRDQAQPYVIGADDAPIVSPLPVDRLPRVQHIITSDAMGEAHAFNVRISSLAAVLAGGVVLMAVMFGASLTLWSGIMWFGSVYAAVWFLAFLWDTVRSPGGIELVNVLSLWQFLRAEQRHRHGRYDPPLPENIRIIRMVIGALAVAMTVFCAVGLVALVAMENMPR